MKKMNGLPEDILKDLKAIKEERFIHEYSKETFDEIFIPWLIDSEDLNENISKISSSYILSKFMLSFLKTITIEIQKKYDLPSLTSKDIPNRRKIDEVKIKISEINDDPLVTFLINESAPTLSKIIERNNISSFNKVVELGLIEDILLVAMEQGEINSVKGYPIEVFSQYVERLTEANLIRETREDIPQMIFAKNVTINRYIDSNETKTDVFDAEYVVVDENVENRVYKEIKRIKSSG